ncbi:TPA: conserved hypothetical protein [Aquificae Joseph's Coat Spring virus]|nr:TPA: conserved hypothetical protein [Aquificae Joseph's Coat Spring virus]
MSLNYTQAPFQPTNPYPNQVTTELDLANQNFTTLANIFVNNDPTTLQLTFNALPPGIRNGYANPINLTSATADYMLQPGEVAYISFTSATSVQLNIATTNGTYYEMDLVLSNNSGTSAVGAPIYLIQNNTTYSNAFRFVEVYYNINTNSPQGYSQTYSAFRISWAVSSIKAYITNFTTNKNINTFYNETGYSTAPDVSIASCLWLDTTTSWTLLGTITFPQASSGYILVRRLA